MRGPYTFQIGDDETQHVPSSFGEIRDHHGAVIYNPDVAYADDPESAVVAARTLCDDAWTARPIHGSVRTVSFYVDDVLVRGPIPEQTVWAAGGLR